MSPISSEQSHYEIVFRTMMQIVVTGTHSVSFTIDKSDPYTFCMIAWLDQGDKIVVLPKDLAIARKYLSDLKSTIQVDAITSSMLPSANELLTTGSDWLKRPISPVRGV